MTEHDEQRQQAPAGGARAAWEAAFAASPRRDADFETMSGVTVEPVYAPADDPDAEYPGIYPYTRGPYA